jgi:hypothetical protein
MTAPVQITLPRATSAARSNAAMDDAIERAISNGRVQFGDICRDPSVATHSPIVSKRGRHVDRRLQALRHAGRIAFNRKLWQWEVIVP